MNIAILGISGYEGHFMAKEAALRNHNIIGISRHATSYHDYACEMKLYDASGSDYTAMKKILKEEKIDVVMSVYPPDIQHPWTFTSDMQSLVNACKECYVKELIMMMGGSANDGRWGENPHKYARFGQQITVGGSYYENIYFAYKGVFEPEKDLHWVVFTPNHLIKYQERTGQYIYKIGGQGGIFYDEHSQLATDQAAINYWDFAVAMFDEAENPREEFRHQRVSLGWPKEVAEEITKKIPVMVNK